MKSSKLPYERWIWLELIGFDNTRKDFGVAEYFDTTGFVPDAVSLLLSSIDFILLHDGMARERPLAKDICSRKGHEHNPERKRQRWTNHQLHGLVRALQKRGVSVYANVFTTYLHNKYHREWASDHPEILSSWFTHKRAGGVHILKRLRDGTYFEDVFIGKLMEVMRDYGFDGWHGGDGFGDVGGPISVSDYSDDMVEQFSVARGIDLPGPLAQPCGEDYGRMETRARWIWRNLRRDWIEFYTDRTARFWRKAVAALHAEGKLGAVNSCRTRDPFESLYAFGYDCRKLAATGVDAIVTETVAAAYAIDPRSVSCGPHLHYDYLAMQMLIKVCMPGTKLVFLHNVHDVVEQWDSLRHCPSVLEKEIYALANACHVTTEGRLRRCADGFLACLGDGVRPEEWQWLLRRWAWAFGPLPRRFHGATVVWSSAAMDAQIDDFTQTRTWTTHQILYHLMTAGAPVQAVAPVEALGKLTGAILAINLHLFPAAERRKVLAYRGGPIIVVCRKGTRLPASKVAFKDVYAPHELRCVVYGASVEVTAPITKDGEERIPADLSEVTDDVLGFMQHPYSRKVSPSFIAACAEAVTQAAAGFVPLAAQEPATVMMSELSKGRLRVVIKSHSPFYLRPAIDMKKPILSAKIAGEFPSMPPSVEGSVLSTRVPPRGIVVLEVKV